MTILFIGLGEKIPTFIERRLLQLDASGGSTILYLHPHQQKQFQAFQHVQFVTYPRKSIRDWSLWIKLFLTACVNPVKVRLLWQNTPIKNTLSRLRWILEKMPLITLSTQIHVIHLQWIGIASQYSWLRKIYDCPIIASARGSQVTVYPTTDAAYRQQIQQDFEAVDYIHCVSQDIAAHCVELGAAKHKLFVNYNGINLKEFYPDPVAAKKSNGQSPFKLITTGALMWRKGYYYQLLVLKNLLEKGLSCHLTIIGSGHEVQGLKYTAQRLSISDQVTFTGQITPDKVRNLLQNSDLYLSTSVAEGLCNSVMEAAACGLPAVVFDCEGMSELIQQGLSGYIVPFGDLTAMTKAIESLYHDPELKESMAAAARKRIEAAFDASYWTVKMIEQYQYFIQTHG